MISFIEQPNEWREFVTSQLQQFSKLPPLQDNSPQEKNRKRKHPPNNNLILVDEDLQSPSVLISVSNRLKNVATITSALDLTSLKYLNISFNGLKSIPNCLSSLSNLEELDISHNKFENLEFIEPLRSLRVFRAHHNRLESILPIAFVGNFLEELWVSENKLDWLEYAFIRDCKNLRVLIKTGNPSDTKAKLPEFLLHYLSSLQILDDKLIANGEFVRMDGGDAEDNNSDAISNTKSSNGPRRGSARSTVDAKLPLATNEKLSTDLKVMITQAKAHYQQQLSLYQQQQQQQRDSQQDTTAVTDDTASVGTNSSAAAAATVGGSHKTGSTKLTRSHSTRSLSSLHTEQDSTLLEKGVATAAGTPTSAPKHSTSQQQQQQPRTLRSSSKDSATMETTAASEKRKRNAHHHRKVTMLVHFPQCEDSSTAVSRSRTNSVDEGTRDTSTPTAATTSSSSSSHRASSRHSNNNNNNNNNNKKVAFCQYSTGEGLFRWQANGCVACRVEQKPESSQLLTVTYPDGTSAAVIEVTSGAGATTTAGVSWQLCDPQGRTLCVTSPSETQVSSSSSSSSSSTVVVSVYDPETHRVLQSYPHPPDQSNLSTDKTAVQWVFPVSVMAVDDGCVSLSYTPQTGEVTVEVSQETLGKAVVSSLHGLQLFPNYPNEIIPGVVQGTTRRHSNPSTSGVPPRTTNNSNSSNSTGKGLQGAQSETANSSSSSSNIRSGRPNNKKPHESKSSDLPQLSELNANLDDLLGDIKQLKENASSSSLKKKK